MIRPKNQIKDLLLLITEKFETPIEQTHTKPQETLEFKMIKPKKTFLFNSPISIEGSWMIILTDLELYNSIFNLNTTINKFNFYKFHTPKSEMRLKETWTFQILQLPI